MGWEEDSFEIVRTQESFLFESDAPTKELSDDSSDEDDDEDYDE